ncbi:hypothetical protein B5C34_04770 [Pacificimonas flava]|uniref:Uncharacterized protein n=2 Tax=Pacificimonas TaxID=1960290 RepID=A0A219B375_9SPHN|nr:hypothetical protein B5C34_04770 [Pacificimonas flava]
MWVGERAQIRFFVAATDAGIERQAGTRTEILPARDLHIGRCMKATFAAPPSIDILSENGVVKPLARDMGRAEWRWTVLPEEPGIYTASVDVEVMEVAADGRCGTTRLDRYEESVDLEISIGFWANFLRAVEEARNAGDLVSALFASWERALVSLAALITAAGGVLIAIRTFGRSRRPEDPS